MYKAITFGRCFTNVTTKEDCEEAASQLGFTANEAIEITDPLNANCYANVGDNQLFFNSSNWSEGWSGCNNNDTVCICKKTSGKH